MKADGSVVTDPAGTVAVRGADMGEVQAPIQKITGRIWFDDDNDGRLTENAADRDGEPGAGGAPWPPASP